MSEEIATAHADLAEMARLRTELAGARAALAQQKHATLAEMSARLNAEADVGWWHATVASYVTSATVTDREILRDTMAEALTILHPGAALMAELEAARAVVAAARSGNYPTFALMDALTAYDASVKARNQ